VNNLWQQFRGREHGPLVQFIKYGIGGAVATAVHVLLFYTLSALFLPALNPGDALAQALHLPVVAVSDAIRARNSAVNNVVAFLFSNLTAYLINVAWVFESGRHARWLEVGFFYGVSGLSVLVGSALMALLIHQFGLTTSVAFFANVLASLAINFVLRKYLIFKR